MSFSLAWNNSSIAMEIVSLLFKSVGEAENEVEDDGADFGGVEDSTEGSENNAQHS